MQIGIVVSDLDEALRAHSAHRPVAQWRVMPARTGPVPGSTYRGQPGTYAVRLAFSGQNPEIELIQSVRGPSIYQEWVDARGYGLHHLAVEVRSLDEAVEEMAAAGFEVAQSVVGFGPNGDGAYAYFDTVALLGYFLEAIRQPSH